MKESRRSLSHNCFLWAGSLYCRTFDLVGALGDRRLVRRVRPEALDWLEEAKADFLHAMQAYPSRTAVKAPAVEHTTIRECRRIAHHTIPIKLRV
jgi:hypothetical protein